uniref:Uncharacterized protein n=1 Tax=Megaselia scalaris TaxID=36166 RepID=T1GHD3_MEGSC
MYTRAIQSNELEESESSRENMLMYYHLPTPRSASIFAVRGKHYWKSSNSSNSSWFETDPFAIQIHLSVFN